MRLALSHGLNSEASSPTSPLTSNTQPTTMKTANVATIIPAGANRAPVGTIQPKDFATWTANLILTAAGKQSTAFRCAMLVAEDMEARGLIK